MLSLNVEFNLRRSNKKYTIYKYERVNKTYSEVSIRNDENILCLNPWVDLDWILGFPYDENILYLNPCTALNWIPGFPYDENILCLNPGAGPD